MYYQSQEIDVCTIHRTSFSFHQLYKHSFACVFCVKVYANLSRVYMCNHNHGQDTKLCHCHSTLSCHPFVATPNFSFTNPYPVAISNLFSISVILLFWICCVNGIIQYMTFEDGLLKFLFFWTFFTQCISLEISLHFLHVSRVPFHCWVAFLGVVIPQFVKAFSHWKKFGSFLAWGYYE